MPIHVHFSYRHGGGHKAIWGGTFDWWWYALLSRVKQIRRVFGGEIIEFALWIILSLLSFFIVHINTVLTHLRNYSFVAITPFFGALLAKFGGGEHKNILMDGVLVHLNSKWYG